MDLLRVEAALLRAQLPDLVLRPGMTLPARVMERAGGYGILLLAGTPLSAQLPDELQPGDRLRLRVEEVGERVVLRAVEGQAPAPAAPPPPELTLPLPGGGAAEVRVTERPAAGRAADEPVTVGVRYDSPALGALDLRLAQQAPGGGLSVTVSATAGAPEERARAAAAELRAALAEATGLTVGVRV